MKTCILRHPKSVQAIYKAAEKKRPGELNRARSTIRSFEASRVHPPLVLFTLDALRSKLPLALGGTSFSIPPPAGTSGGGPEEQQ
jgi:hypothetical protein